MPETIIQIKHNRVKNPNWPEANQLAIYKRGRGSELETTMKQNQLAVRAGLELGASGLQVQRSQPRTQACSRYPSDQRRLGTERDSARRPRRIFPTSLTGDVTSQIAEDDWELGCSALTTRPLGHALSYKYNTWT